MTPPILYSHLQKDSQGILFEYFYTDSLRTQLLTIKGKGVYKPGTVHTINEKKYRIQQAPQRYSYCSSFFGETKYTLDRTEAYEAAVKCHGFVSEVKEKNGDIHFKAKPVYWFLDNWNSEIRRFISYKDALETAKKNYGMTTYLHHPNGKVENVTASGTILP